MTPEPIPPTVRRFSSRRERLDHVFLRDRLRDASSYDRIAGYFRSSIFEVAAEEIARIDRVRIVCNSDLDPDDLRTSQAIREQALVARWWEGGRGELPLEIESLLHRTRYRRLAELLSARDGNGEAKVQIRVVDRTTAPLVHGKAGIITARSGARTCFMGSVNETLDAWQKHYEILWEDTSDEGIAWTQEEFDFLWAKAVPLPQAIIREVERCAEREEIAVPDCTAWQLPAAAMAEAPIARAGEGLQPWQKAFVAEFLRHRDWYGKARLLLADEVGVGKTLSLATSALVASLLGDGPALILAPAQLCEQWQTELKDRLGIPSARWLSARKDWVDQDGNFIRGGGPEGVGRCPCRIAIISTGLIFQQAPEGEVLLRRRAARGESAFGTLILDEAHRARAQMESNGDRRANNLLRFMSRAATKARHVLLGTATPIQTDIRELWDLLEILDAGAGHVLGPPLSPWRRLPDAVDIVAGRRRPRSIGEGWEWLRHAIPSRRERDPIFGMLRQDLSLDDATFTTDRAWTALDAGMVREEIDDRLRHDREGLGFLQANNPVVRHTVLRRRTDLEQAGLLRPVAVDLYPRDDENDQQTRAYFADGNKGIATSPQLNEALAAAERFCNALASRKRGAGYIKSLLLQRICSSAASGLATSRVLLGEPASRPDAGGRPPEAARFERLRAANSMQEDDNEELLPDQLAALGNEMADERQELQDAIAILEDIVAQPRNSPAADPKWRVLRHFLIERDWLRHGAIVFSQFFDTVFWAATSLAAELPTIPVAVYAGAGRSGVFREGQFVACPRDDIKKAVREGAIRLLVATDAACEGLNLQTLGTLINVDLPWNPSRLEQRIGRIKRFGQRRDTVDMLNMVYTGTRDEVVYDRLSSRMRDRFDLFGQLPDVIEDSWIDDAAALDRELDTFIEKRRAANAFSLRWGGTATGTELTDEERAWQAGWESCSRVISRRDVSQRMAEGW
jgi:superfamily II DNA or RNA helicase